MNDFSIFQSAIASKWAVISKHQLFVVDIDKDLMWDTYLNSFPEGSNPIYRKRTEHDCSCCRRFIKAVGHVVAVINGEVTSIWDVNILSQPAYQEVAKAMSRLIKTRPIQNIFMHAEASAGSPPNFEQLVDGVRTYDHFHVHIPAKFVKPGKVISTLLNDARGDFDVLHRSLTSIDLDAVNAVLELIDQNSLYRGSEHKATLTTFAQAKRTLTQHHDIWLASTVLPKPVVRIRNTSIGTLLTDLSEGMSIEDAVRKFEVMVAPANYKRPTALVTKSMIEGAKAKIQELGLTTALERRYATLDDISINNVLFADRSARKLMRDVFDDLGADVAVNPKTFSKVEEVPIEKFIADILPKTTSIEVLLENSHTGKLMSLVAPVDPTAPNLFKWNNGFSWSYNGDVADSMKEKVKKAGGNVTGDLCCRLAWDYTDDLDLHMYEPGNGHLYYGNRYNSSACGGRLDVDANGGSGMMDEPVENIFYASKRTMKPGRYELKVYNYCARQSTKRGFEVEIEFNGEIHHIAYDKALRVGETVAVASIDVSRAGVISITNSLPTTTASKSAWGLKTQTFCRVNAVMLSPNYWDEQGVGNKHFLFMLDGCRNDGTARGFYNEFLKSDLDQHRKVMEMVGAKMRTETEERQLSGLGFSSTQRASLTCKVSGAFTRVINVTF